MSRTTAAVAHRALPAATALVFGGGLALYQLTSLVLGPPATRQLHLSLSIPAFDRNDRSQPVTSSVTPVLGSLARVVGARSAAGRLATSGSQNAATRAAAVAPSSPATPTATVSPVPTPAPRPSDHPRRVVVPTPRPPKDDDAD